MFVWRGRSLPKSPGGDGTACITGGVAGGKAAAVWGQVVLSGQQKKTSPTFCATVRFTSFTFVHDKPWKNFLNEAKNAGKVSRKM